MGSRSSGSVSRPPCREAGLVSPHVVMAEARSRSARAAGSSARRRRRRSSDMGAPFSWSSRWTRRPRRGQPRAGKADCPGRARRALSVQRPAFVCGRRLASTRTRFGSASRSRRSTMEISRDAASGSTCPCAEISVESAEIGQTEPLLREQGSARVRRQADATGFSTDTTTLLAAGAITCAAVGDAARGVMSGGILTATASFGNARRSALRAKKSTGIWNGGARGITTARYQLNRGPRHTRCSTAEYPTFGFRGPSPSP